jgi:hypothetical protein
VAVTTTTEAATTTTLSELEQAQIAYFYMSGEINGIRTAEWDKACGAKGPGCSTLSWSAWKEYCIAVAPALERFAAAVAAYKWPDGAQDKADALVARRALEAQIYYGCKDAKTNSDLRAIEQELFDLGPDGTAAALRLALGLPINQG